MGNPVYPLTLLQRGLGGSSELHVHYCMMGVSVPLLILLQGWVGVGTVSPLTPVFCNVCVCGGGGGGGGGIYTTVGWGFL